MCVCFCLCLCCCRCVCIYVCVCVCANACVSKDKYHIEDYETTGEPLHPAQTLHPLHSLQESHYIPPAWRGLSHGVLWWRAQVCPVDVRYARYFRYTRSIRVPLWRAGGNEMRHFFLLQHVVFVFVFVRGGWCALLMRIVGVLFTTLRCVT